jgi:hypothetical protein
LPLPAPCRGLMPGDLGSFQVSTEYKSLSFTGSLGSLVATLELCVVLAGNDTGMMEALIPEGGAPPLSNIPTDAALRQLVRREVRSFVSQPEVQQFLAMQHFATPGGQPSTWTGEASRGITPRHDASLRASWVGASLGPSRCRQTRGVDGRGRLGIPPAPAPDRARVVPRLPSQAGDPSGDVRISRLRGLL